MPLNKPTDIVRLVLLGIVLIVALALFATRFDSTELKVIVFVLLFAVGFEIAWPMMPKIWRRHHNGHC